VNRLRWLLISVLATALGLWFVFNIRWERVDAPLFVAQQGANCLYVPLVYRDCVGVPTVDPNLYPPSVTPWPSKTTEPTLTPSPTRTRVPWPQGDVPAEIPLIVRWYLLDQTRQTRGVEPWEEVCDDILLEIAGNLDYGAQISTIAVYTDDTGRRWRGMETCRGFLIEDPEGRVWVVIGYSGPIGEVRRW